MADYSESTVADVSADDVFTFLSDVRNLPAYFPRITSATKTAGNKVDVTARIAPDGGAAHDVQGEAWFDVDEAQHTLTWGAQGPNNYSGQLDLDDTGDGRCTITVRITTENADGNRVRDGLKEAVAGVKEAVEKRG